MANNSAKIWFLPLEKYTFFWIVSPSSKKKIFDGRIFDQDLRIWRSSEDVINSYLAFL